MRTPKARRWRLSGLIAGGTLLALLLSQYGTASAAIALPDNVPVAASGPTAFSFGTYHPRWTVLALHPGSATLSASVRGPAGTVSLPTVSSASLGTAFVALDTRTVPAGAYTASVAVAGPAAAYRVEHDPGRSELTPELRSTEFFVRPGVVMVWRIWLDAGDVFEVGRRGSGTVLGALVAPAAASLVPVPPHTSPPSPAPGWVPGMVPGTHTGSPATPAGCPYLSRWPAARVSGWYGLVLRNTDSGTSRPVRLQRSGEAGNPCALP